ncbi:MAG TPA: AP2 domain-containing protein [Solirubrobacterales bacterium]|nr:AP2 domain-containing protein [Solirubrobacterales bacterium]
MGTKLTEARTDHESRPLPAGIYALTREDGTIASYKTRWRAEDANGVPRNASKSFSVAKFGSADKALQAAIAHRTRSITTTTPLSSRPDPSTKTTVAALFQEWCVKRGAVLSRRYSEDAVKRWDREIAPRPISQVQLGRLSQDPSILTRFQDELEADGLTPSNRAQILKILRAVLRWGRRRYPNALTLELSGLFEVPTHSHQRLAYSADAYGLERIIEAVLHRHSRNKLLPLRDAALVAAMGFTIAARPSEWLHSATWSGLHKSSIELQRPDSDNPTAHNEIGLKTGARAALLLPNAHDRITAYRLALEAEFGPQPEHALVFQALDPNGPIWDGKAKKATPTPWSYNYYKRWTARIWRPARNRAATAPAAPQGLNTMRFYDCRHTAISMALHSTLVSGPHGMNLHNLAGWAGHDVQTLQRYYAHVIARYQNTEPIDLTAECQAAREKVESNPAYD